MSPKSDEPVLCNLVYVSKGTPVEFHSRKDLDTDLFVSDSAFVLLLGPRAKLGWGFAFLAVKGIPLKIWGMPCFSLWCSRLP